MKSKTKIGKQIKKKTNPNLVETVKNAKKHKGWFDVARILSGPRRKSISINLDEIDKISKDKEHIVIPGKILSQGKLNKKIEITALGFSEGAREKLLKHKINFSSINEEIKKNPSAKNIRILTNIGKKK